MAVGYLTNEIDTQSLTTCLTCLFLRQDVKMCTEILGKSGFV